MMRLPGILRGIRVGDGGKLRRLAVGFGVRVRVRDSGRRAGFGCAPAEQGGCGQDDHEQDEQRVAGRGVTEPVAVGGNAADYGGHAEGQVADDIERGEQAAAAVGGNVGE
jgi:hypothetical protein